VRDSVARRVRVGVIGAGTCDEEVTALATRVGETLADADAVVVCGGLGGVMAAVARGAASRGGIVVGVLPGADASEANPWVTIPIPTGIGHARNVLVVTASEALVALPGSAGTRSEMAFANVLGRELVALGRHEHPAGVTAVTLDPVEAATMAIELALRSRSARTG